MSWDYQPLVSAAPLQTGGPPPSYSLTADTGAFASSGGSANFIRSRRLAAANAAFPVSGKAVAFPRELRLPVEPGSVSLDGSDADLGAPTTTFTAEAGTMLCVGKSAGLRLARRLSATPAAFQANGVAAAIEAASAGGASRTLHLSLAIGL
jgi:hypothetical protein